MFRSLCRQASGLEVVAMILGSYVEFISKTNLERSGLILLKPLRYWSSSSGFIFASDDIGAG
jgi:hypothetical protein